MSLMKPTWCCATVAVKLQSWHSQLTLYARNIPSAVCEAPPEDEQVMLETCRGPWFSINWMKSASRWFHYTDKWFSFIAHSSGHRMFNVTCLFTNNLDTSSVGIGPSINNEQLHVYLMFAFDKEQVHSSANYTIKWRNSFTSMGHFKVTNFC
jgi:hypothetical protein